MKRLILIFVLTALAGLVSAYSCRAFSDDAAKQPPPSAEQLGGFASVDERVRATFKYAVEQQSVNTAEKLYKALIKQGADQGEAYRQSLDVGFRSLLAVEASTLARLDVLIAAAGDASAYAKAWCQGKAASTELESLILPLWNEERRKAEGTLPLMQSE